MSLSVEDRKQMIDLYVNRALALMAEADEYFDMKRYATSANRYYYACFHALHALFVTEGLFPRSHEGVDTLFGLHFVKKNLFDKKYGSFITRMEALREKSDYNVLFEVTELDLVDMKPLVHDLIREVQIYLSNLSNKKDVEQLERI